MATHSSTLAWQIPWTEEPGRLQSMGSLGVGHDCTKTVEQQGSGGSGSGSAQTQETKTAYEYNLTLVISMMMVTG